VVDTPMTPRLEARQRATPLVAVLLAGIAWLAPVAAAPAGPAARVDEYRLKAAILYSLIKFVDWPADSFSRPADPLVICVLGTDPFGQTLDDVLRGHTVASRPIVARRVTDTTGGCHVVFTNESDPNRLAAILDRLRKSTVLTVGEADGFTGTGGMVGLATAGERVRFDINADALEAARLRVSPQVLALATAVRRSGGRGR
jgi:hypothetical protein